MTFLYIVLIIVAAAAVWGWMQGLVHQIGSFAGLLVAIVVCRVFGPKAAAFACADIAPGSDSTFISILAYIALGIVTYLAVWMLVRMLRRMIHGLRLGIVDKFGGALYKAVLWSIVISLIYNLYICVAPARAPESSSTEDVWKQRILEFAPAVFGSDSAQDIFDTVRQSVTGD